MGKDSDRSKIQKEIVLHYIYMTDCGLTIYRKNLHQSELCIF